MLQHCPRRHARALHEHLRADLGLWAESQPGAGRAAERQLWAALHLARRDDDWTAQRLWVVPARAADSAPRAHPAARRPLTCFRRKTSPPLRPRPASPDSPKCHALLPGRSGDYL